VQQEMLQREAQQLQQQMNNSWGKRVSEGSKAKRAECVGLGTSGREAGPIRSASSGQSGAKRAAVASNQATIGRQPATGGAKGSRALTRGHEE